MDGQLKTEHHSNAANIEEVIQATRDKAVWKRFASTASSHMG